MPVASYLVYPVDGQKEQLVEALSALPECSVLPSTNADLLILVTETAGWAEDKALHEELRRCDALQCLVLAMGEVDGDMEPAIPEVMPEVLPALPPEEEEVPCYG